MESFKKVNKIFSLGTAGTAVCIDAEVKDVPLRFEGSENGIAVYRDEENRLTAEAFAQTFDGLELVRQKTRVKALDSFTLTQATSAKIDGVCLDENGIKDRLGDGSILIHYCLSRWQGEGQWRTATPEDLGIYTATGHAWEKSWCRFDSVSSWSTATYYPLIVIEDKKRGESWFFEIEGGHSWFLEIYGIGGDKLQSLSVKAGGADERSGFAKKMKLGDEFETCACVYGVAEGGFEEAVRALIAYKRKTSLAQGGCPLTFNDYMNCNWAIESAEALIPLIDKAADLGIEIFCIDDGWQERLGLWYPADGRFGDKKLQGIFDYIRSKGMRIGVWFEFESIPADMAERLGADDCFLFRHDRMIAPKRPLANMRSEKLVAYLNERVDALYDMGVRFIKNDHNNTEYIGPTLYGESAGEGLEANNRAFLSFIDGIRKRHPDLIVENCASGAMRSDNGTLKHFNIQSTSDQEDYLSYTSVLAGSLALMAPEKAGIWCYPYALRFDDRTASGLTPEQAAEYADGEETVFNVVNGFMGCMYVSGKLHQADGYNTALLKEGLDLYKARRLFIRESFPVFPRGMIRISDRTYNAVGLIDGAGKKLLLAVWNLSDSGRKITLDLRKYGMARCEKIYPLKKEGVAYRYENGRLTVEFETGKTARLFELNI